MLTFRVKKIIAKLGAFDDDSKMPGTMKTGATGGP